MSETVDRHTSDDNTITILWHDIPVKTLLQRDALYEHIGTVDGGDGLRQEDLLGLHTIIIPGLQRLLAYDLLDVQAMDLVLLIDLTVDRGSDDLSFASHSDMMFSVGIDKGTETVDLDSFITGKDHRQVVGNLPTEMQATAFCKMQVDIGTEGDTSCQPVAGRNRDRSPTPLGCLVNGLLNGFRCQSLLGHLDSHRQGWEDGTFQLRHLKRSRDGRNLLGHNLRTYLLSHGLCHTGKHRKQCHA